MFYTKKSNKYTVASKTERYSDFYHKKKQWIVAIFCLNNYLMINLDLHPLVN